MIPPRAVVAIIATLALAACGSSHNSGPASTGTTPASTPALTPIPSVTPATANARLGKYPAVNEQAYLESCVRAATAHIAQAPADKYCRVSLACIEQRLSLRQFLSLNQAIIYRQPSPYAKVALACSRIGARSLIAG